MFERIKAFLSTYWLLSTSIANKIIPNNRGETRTVISLFVAVFLFGILMPVSFQQIFGANTTGWDTMTVTVWNLIPLLAVVAMILVLIYKVAGK
jgi:uncharacterized BrkB/YihY/UPF0761 family membrane protein